MNDSKQIIKYCPNYYKIIEFNPIQGDEITGRIIKLYHEYIFSIDVYDESAVNEVKELDAAVAKYINDYSFRKEVQKQMRNFKIKENNRDIIKLIISFIIKIFSSYEDYTTRVIYISRWI